MSQPISKALLSAQKALIRSCMAQGVGIEFLDDSAPAFRFVPPPETQGSREAAASFAKPSKRKALTIKCRNRGCACHKSKWYRHEPLSASASYDVPMAGDDAELTQARQAYHEGQPQALRDWLSATADERRATWQAIDAKRAGCHFDRMTGDEFRKIEEQLDLEPRSMGKLLGVGWRTVYRYESGDTAIPEPVAKLVRLIVAHSEGDGAKALDSLAAGTL